MMGQPNLVTPTKLKTHQPPSPTCPRAIAGWVSVRSRKERAGCVGVRCWRDWPAVIVPAEVRAELKTHAYHLRLRTTTYCQQRHHLHPSPTRPQAIAVCVIVRSRKESAGSVGVRGRRDQPAVIVPAEVQRKERLRSQSMVRQLKQ